MGEDNRMRIRPRKQDLQSENECDASGRLAWRVYFVSTEQTPVALPRTPSFNKARPSRCSDIAHTINMCHNACDPPPSQAKRGESIGRTHSGK